MRLALRLAGRGAGWVSPNPMVGAVVVQKGQVVGRGYHRLVGGPHAEVEVLERAGEKARGADLYVTLEPCNHQGRTPPCTQAILAAGVRRVVIASPDPNPQVEGGGAAFLVSKGVEVEVGLLEAEARRLNEAWFKWVSTGLPLVIAKAACSLDGKIATSTGESQWLTGEAARVYGHRLRHRVDAILVGLGTVLADDPQLTTRLPLKKTENRKQKTVFSKTPSALSWTANCACRSLLACYTWTPRPPPGWPASRKLPKIKSRLSKSWAQKSWSFARNPPNPAG